MAISKGRRDASEEISGADTLILDFKYLELWENKFCCLSHFVAAQFYGSHGKYRDNQSILCINYSCHY